MPQQNCSAMALLSWWGLEHFVTRKICISFSSFIRSDFVLPQQNCSAMVLFFLVRLRTFRTTLSLLLDLFKNFVNPWALHCLSILLGDFVLDVEGSPLYLTECSLNVLPWPLFLTMVFICIFPDWSGGCPRDVMVKAMDCGIIVRKFVLQSRYYVHFRANTLGKGMNPLILPAMG